MICKDVPFIEFDINFYYGVYSTVRRIIENVAYFYCSLGAFDRSEKKLFQNHANEISIFLSYIVLIYQSFLHEENEENKEIVMMTFS